MKKMTALLLAVVLCLSLWACDSSPEPNTPDEPTKAKKETFGYTVPITKPTEPAETELTVYNFQDYLTVSFEIQNFKEGRLAPDVDLYSPAYDLVIVVSSADPDYTFQNTVLTLVLTDKANSTNLDLSVDPVRIEIDENGNGIATREDCGWMASSVTIPQYDILIALSEVTGIVVEH